MDDGNTYEAYTVARYIMANEKWMSKMKSMNERDRLMKICNIMPAACRDMKLKLTDAKQTFARHIVMRGIKKLA